MKKNSFLSEAEVSDLGLKQVGQNVSISRLASFYGTENIAIGNNVRIDDFCILSGRITIGNYIHVAAGCYLYGGEQGIELNDFVNLSSRIVIYSKSDDYSGTTLQTQPYRKSTNKSMKQRSFSNGTFCLAAAAWSFRV
jgi:carbonic anhydrase/acetyltransferase-like protein (isoleucine patch superfamily)